MKQKEQKAIDGLIELWSDMYAVCGKADKASQLKLNLKPILKKSGSLVHDLIGSSPEELKFYIEYADTPKEIRREKMEQFLTTFARITIECCLYILMLGTVYAAIWSISEGLSFKEVETLLKQILGQELSDTILGEMSTKLKDKGILVKSTVRLSPSGLGLSPSSVAGANARLKNVLEERLKQLGQNRSDYQQDLSIALWECIRGENLNEFVAALGEDITKQAEALKQIMGGKQDKLVRSTLLRIVRMAVEDLPDINQEIKDMGRGDKTIPLPDDIDSTKISTLWPQNPELSQEEGRQAIIEALAHRGIEYTDLTPQQWEEIFEKYDLIRKGYEFSSKKGVSISSFYGEAAHAKEQKWSLTKKKISELTQ
jgi:hypothetical protein